MTSTTVSGFAYNLEIHTSSYYGNICTLKAILKLDLPSINIPNVDGNTPLMMALYGPNRKVKPQVVRLLLSYGADVDVVNKKGDSALHAAVQGVLTGRGLCRIYFLFFRNS